MFEELLKAHRDEIGHRWFERLVATYPSQAGVHLRSGKDRFRNPVGHELREGTSRLVDGLIGGGETTALQGPLEGILKVRAVQEFTASEAVRFVFELKGVVREVAAKASPEVLAALDAAVDRLALLAFDVYMGCRERLYEIRANEIRNRTHLLLERTRLFSGPPAE